MALLLAAVMASLSLASEKPSVRNSQTAARIAEKELWILFHEAERTRIAANTTVDAKTAVELFKSTVNAASNSAVGGGVQGAAMFHLGEMFERVRSSLFPHSTNAHLLMLGYRCES